MKLCLLFCWALFITGLVAWPTLYYPVGSDQGTFLYIARIWQEGLLPYRDALDTKPIGIFALYALADIIFGKSLAAFRLMEALLGALSIFSFKALFRRLGQSEFSGIISHALFVSVYFIGYDYWNLGQVEFALGLLLLNFVLLLLKLRDNAQFPAYLALFGGVLLACAFLLKQNYILVGGAFIFVLWRSGQRFKNIFTIHLKPLLWFTLGGTLVLGLLGLYFAINGGLYDLYYGMLRLPVLYSRHSELPATPLTFYSPYLALYGLFTILTLAGLFNLFSRTNEASRILLVGSGFTLLCIVIQKKFWFYHLITLLPFVAVFMGIGLARILDRLSETRVPFAFLQASAIALIAGQLLILASGITRRTIPSGNSNHYLGAVANILKFQKGEISKTGLYDTFYGPYTSAASDYKLAQKILELSKPGQSLQLFEFRPAIYIYANRFASHKFFFGTLLQLVGSREMNRLLPVYLELTYKSRRPDFIIFGLDGLWNSPRAKPLNPVDKNYILKGKVTIHTYGTVTPENLAPRTKRLNSGIFENQDERTPP